MIEDAIKQCSPVSIKKAPIKPIVETVFKPKAPIHSSGTGDTKQSNFSEIINSYLFEVNKAFKAQGYISSVDKNPFYDIADKYISRRVVLKKMSREF